MTGPTCSCTPHPYGDGPELDCPVHGAVQALNQANAEIERLRAREDESLPMKVRSVSVEQDRIEVVADMFLTADEAVLLANQLTDAVDELEAVSGE